jgi:WD40 repeat protein
MKKTLAFLTASMFLTAWAGADAIPTTGEEIMRFHLHSSPVVAVALSSSCLAAATQDGTLGLYSAHENKEMFHQDKIFSGHDIHMIFSDDLGHLAVSDGSGQVWVFPTRQPFKPAVFKMDGDVVCLVYDVAKNSFKAVMADGKVLTVPTVDAVVDDWDLSGETKVTSFQFYPESDDYLIGRDGQVGWGSGSKVFHTAQIANGSVAALVTGGQDDQYFMALDSALNLNYFEYDKRKTSATRPNEIKLLGQSPLTTGTANLTALSKDGSVVLSTGSTLEFYRYDFGGKDEDGQVIAPSSKDVGSTSVENQTITALAMSDDSKYIAVGLNDGSLSYRRHPILLKTFLKFMDKEQAAEQLQHWESAAILCVQANGIFPQPWLMDRSQDLRGKEMEQRQQQREKLLQMQRQGQ